MWNLEPLSQWRGPLLPFTAFTSFPKNKFEQADMLKAMNAKRHASLEATDAVAEKAFMV